MHGRDSSVSSHDITSPTVCGLLDTNASGIWVSLKQLSKSELSDFYPRTRGT